jgi:hypothetical protein
MRRREPGDRMAIRLQQACVGEHHGLEPAAEIPEVAKQADPHALYRLIQSTLDRTAPLTVRRPTQGS